MQVFATFEYTPFLEIVIAELKDKGVEEVYAVPLDLRQEEASILDGMHRADGISFLDKGFILAFMFATIGASKGFVWQWGPIIWGLIGALFGILLGMAINGIQYVAGRRKEQRRIAEGKQGSVILIVTCDEGQTAMVKKLLWDHLAIGLAVTT